MYNKLEILNMITGNTLAVMLCEQEKRQDFRTAIRLHESLAQEENDTPMIKLIDTENPGTGESGDGRQRCTRGQIRGQVDNV
ncbi:MAG: hypothetical protein GY874_16645 [Desulfobacteraceae bacterium]|nr:hypothetical protein [Desulfobacteraceae bacterium]